MKKLNLHIEVNNKYWDEFCSVQHAINGLIDLVNSQQEAIGELQTEIGVLRNMVLQSQEAIEKLEKQVHGTKRIDHLVTSVTTAEGGIVTIRFNEEALKEYAKSFVEPAEDPDTDTHRTEKVDPRDMASRNPSPEAKKALETAVQEAQEDINRISTHRTVTLRIPKGMSIVEAIEEAYQDTIIHTDTDLQKALDEVKE